MNGSDAILDEALYAVANGLAAKAGKARVGSLSRLTGGKNNQVYRADMEHGEPLVLKRYFSDPRDPRDRLSAEWSFLQYARARGVRAAPQPLAKDAAERAGLYRFVQGRKLTATEIGAVQIDAAIDFVLAVNVSPRKPLMLAPASEACFSLAEHLDTVERRVARLLSLDPDAPHIDDARQFVTDALVPAWTATKQRIVVAASAAGLLEHSPIAATDCCLSPSDFGFHNALADARGRLTFLDFEYAGRDDPAKLVSDFFCQPEIPVSLKYHGHFVKRLADGLGLDEAARLRCQILLDAYRIKWTCIILNDFLSLGAARRTFADAGMRAQSCAKQLMKAKNTIAGMATCINDLM